MSGTRAAILGISVSLLLTGTTVTAVLYFERLAAESRQRLSEDLERDHLEMLEMDRRQQEGKALLEELDRRDREGKPPN